MTDHAHPLLRCAARRWRGGSLWPYCWLATAVAGISAIGIVQLQWSGWILFACLAAIALAQLLDRNWRLSTTEICRKLDGHFAPLQDSSQLLNNPPDTLGPLAQVQRQRTAAALQQLLDSGALKNFRPPWHRSAVANAIGVCLGLLVFVIANTLPQSDAPGQAPGAQAAVAAASIEVAEAVTEIQPPTYTGLPALTQSLQVKAPEQSRISWRVTLNAPANALMMLAARENFSFSTTETLPSRHWQLTRTLAETDFYQLSVHSGEEEILLPQIHNIEIEADRAPEFSFSLPRDNVTTINAYSEASPLLQVDVEVADDFQVTKTDLLITLASGDGENVRFRNDKIKLEPTDTAEGAKRYRFNVPIERYQVEPGDELYWFLQARDNREPEPNMQKSQHFIIRWPQEEIFGLSDAEGMAIKVLPDYFRSQRQLIIDTEALLAEREQLSERDFRKRSESLAYEQNLLRMRYGRFLGEEDSALEHDDESGHDHEAHGESVDAHGEEHEHDDHEDHEDHGNHGHDHEAPPQQFGDASGVIAAAGHSHDTSEHATLFDPQTKELLRSALNAMWSSWRELSVIEPHASLPHQHTALRNIKQVQQASRIYLQRVGFEPPALDESRRLSGERDDVKPPRVNAARSDDEREQLLKLLQRVRADDALDDGAVKELLSLPQLREQPQLRVELSKSLRLYRQQEDCTDCRRQLSALLYQLLPAPQAQPSLPRERAAADSFDSWLREQSRGRE
ncbi:hypothetical protein [Microbulbifer sp.]|uniref:hypothetical protein n=1 Tax=Microbulbifer sp. TaxID=1908541 RepID=UPI003F3592C2